ncbi:rhodanese-like domain-containing protein [Larkinella soli]|uniref:rhodanese-like domain-containing protein n=1 Tax=Larkinella soli TaxID=1770527 RepID=UPI000FFBE421|nr:rhodanese-like domain-containing protein [Larkinella soli]
METFTISTTRSGRVAQYQPGDTVTALAHFYHKLCFETDASDVFHDQRDGIDTFVVVDARSAESYRQEHIPGAVSLPHRQMNAETTEELPRDKIIVVYCDGIGCNASTKGAAKLVSLGFRCKELLGGIDWWKRDGFPTSTGEAPGSLIECGC